MSDEKINNKKEYHKKYNKEYHSKNRSIKITITPKEFTAIETEASRHGMKPGTFLREIALSRVEGKPVIPDDLKSELKRLNILVRNISNNVNQIARHSNSIKKLVDERNLVGELSGLSRLVHEFVEDKV